MRSNGYCTYVPKFRLQRRILDEFIEPTIWNLRYTDNTPIAGSGRIGFRASIGANQGSWLNTDPLHISIDNLSANSCSVTDGTCGSLD